MVRMPSTAFFCAWAVLGFFVHAQAPRITAPTYLQGRGDLMEAIAEYKTTLPGRDTQAFVQPGEDEVALAMDAVRAAQAGDLIGAAATLDEFGYDLVTFTDSRTERAHLMMRERVPCGRCWGLYLFSQSPSRRNVTVEAPHPLFDLFTPEFAIEAYLRLDAEEFLMAGAHRYANGPDSLVSDMARNPASLFQAIHVALTDPQTHVLQYHGFALQNHPDYPNVVLSNGSPVPHAELAALWRAMEARGETVGVYDGHQWAALGATLNPQGRHTNSISGRFYHMEHYLDIRRDPSRRTAMIDAVLEVVQ